MSGTFSSLSTALSALHYNRVAMDVHAGNVANVGTDGYARRRVVGESVAGPDVPALWSRYDAAGAGVRVSSIDRMVDPLLDARARTEHSEQFLLDGRAEVLLRVESGLGEPGDNGVAAALTEYWNGWHDVANNPGDGAARSQLIARAENVTAAFSGQARTVTTEWSDQRTKLDALATEVNTIAGDLAELNDSIRVATATGTEAGTLLDRRDQLTLRLAELVGARSTVAGDGSVEVQVSGATLVSGTTTGTFAVSDGAALGESVRLTVGGTDVTVTGGAVGAVTSLLVRTLPDYLARLDAVAAEFATAVNDQHRLGYDKTAANAPGGDFFTGTTAATLQVAISDPDRIAASGVQGTLDSSNAHALAALSAGDESYRRLVTDFGAEVASARRVADNQRVLTNQVDGSREALSGIDIDEEMVQMLAHQRAYEAAARVITTIDSVLDTLINRMGLVR
ncbi:MAG: flagellar hook-associated protein FlgK [Actinomycetota bacterium]|nr:flagellar hook-associated protein FlgK [Actinomycetota bacterium]